MPDDPRTLFEFAGKTASGIEQGEQAAIDVLTNEMEEALLRSDAAMAIGDTLLDQETAKRVLPAVQKLMAGEDKRLHRAGLWALGGLGDAGAPDLARHLETGNSEDFIECCRVVGDRAHSRHKFDAGPLLSALIEGIDRPDPLCRRKALSALYDIGIPRLRKALHDPDEEVRRAAMEALSRIGTDGNASRARHDEGDRTCP